MPRPPATPTRHLPTAAQHWPSKPFSRPISCGSSRSTAHPLRFPLQSKKEWYYCLALPVSNNSTPPTCYPSHPSHLRPSGPRQLPREGPGPRAGEGTTSARTRTPGAASAALLDNRAADAICVGHVSEQLVVTEDVASEELEREGASRGRGCSSCLEVSVMRWGTRGQSAV